jgi:hypothetical protein
MQHFEISSSSPTFSFGYPGNRFSCSCYFDTSEQARVHQRTHDVLLLAFGRPMGILVG